MRGWYRSRQPQPGEGGQAGDEAGIGEGGQAGDAGVDIGDQAGGTCKGVGEKSAKVGIGIKFFNNFRITYFPTQHPA